MEKLGDVIMNELETAEQEVCSAWGEFHATRLCLYSQLLLINDPSMYNFFRFVRCLLQQIIGIQWIIFQNSEGT